MSISETPWDLHKAGSKDAYRHREKLQDAFKKKLHDIISQEDIITSDNGRTVKVPIKALDNYRFIFDPKNQKQVGQGDGDTKKGDVLQKEGDKQKGSDKAGDQEGEEYYEAEIELEELIEMMLEDLKLPRLDPKKQNNITTKEIEYDDVRKRGKMSNIDKKRSLIENLKRNAKDGQPAKVKDFTMDDLRFRTWSEHERPVTSAVVFALMDVSGSMGEEKKYLARSFFFWMVNFLRHKYDNVEVQFISHTTEAHIVNEHDFFHRAESGGTQCSSAYKLALDTIKTQYDVSQWNVFTFHFSDGDTFMDEDKCVSLQKELIEICNMVGYGEISLTTVPYGMYGSSSSKLSSKYRTGIKSPNFVMGHIRTKSDVWRVLKKFFSESDLENGR